MKIVYSPRCLEFGRPGHPESPERVEKAAEFLKGKDYEFLEPEKCEEEDLLSVHSQKFIDRVKNGNFSSMDSPAYENIYDYARLSAGGGIKASEVNGFSLMRPPGHHATRNSLGGFCYFNNIAIAVEKLRKKTAIIDFDCHFGNGTSSIFYNSPDILYFSIHQWPAYPGGGKADELGQGKGKGYTLNVPLPSSSSDDIYLEVLEEFIPLIRDQFNPEVVAVSAGFDAHRLDPLMGMNLSTNLFYEVGRKITENFQNSFYCLEGGYGPEVSKCCDSFLQGVKKGENPKYEERTTSPSPVKKKSQKQINQLKKYLSDYWEL